MARLTVASADTAMDAFLVPTTVYYMSLHTADPALTGANEVTGGSYARQAITFVAASGGSKASGGADGAQSFPSMPAVAVAYIGIWSASSGGTYICGATASVNGGAALPVGATVAFASGAATFTDS